MSIVDWFNSDPVRKFRLEVLGKNQASACRRCYAEEDHGGNSRRLRSNQKSVIFTRTAFDDSFEQSPGYHQFLHSNQHQGKTLTHPIDIHVDLGNFCNLACKMCNPQASSTIASQQFKWCMESSRQYLGSDWTRDTKVWSRFKQQLLEIPELNNIHFMGGETLLTDRFEDLVDTMLAAGRTELCFSFVSNGTVYKPALVEKLRNFRRVGFEVSIESLTAHNAYQRQGTDTQLVLDNIQRYLEILPSSVKSLYLARYDHLLNTLSDVTIGTDYNASDPNNYRSVIREQVEMCRDILSTPTPSDAEEQQQALVQHCSRWDQVYGLNARELYPEWTSILDRYGYPG